MTTLDLTGVRSLADQGHEGAARIVTEIENVRVPRPVDVVTDQSEFPANTLHVYQRIAALTGGRVIAFGSRIDGRWNAESDYDVEIPCLPPTLRRAASEFLTWAVQEPVDVGLTSNRRVEVTSA